MLVYALFSTSVALSAHASGIFTISYFDRHNSQDATTHESVLDGSTAGFFTFAPEPFDASIALNDTPLPIKEDSFAENQALYEEIYLSQLFEELQLMNDYDELLTALSIQEARNAEEERQVQLAFDHDYHEVMGAYSYHLEFEHLMNHLANLQLNSDYDELMDALAAVDLDSQAFDIRFSDATYTEDDTPEATEEIDFAKLSPSQRSELQERMEHGELAEVDRAIRHGYSN